MASRVVAHDEIDFEVAIQFLLVVECPHSEYVSMGLPLGGSFAKQEYYARRHAREFASGIVYSHFNISYLFGN